MEKSKKKALLENSELIRNICIMAHVDHGKTTMADALIASNGVINQRQAGKIRYMDSRKDEVERGITMKSSCITLTYPRKGEVFVINLIDSPGHVDFSSEVSTAVRLCDGTIIVVDVVEGVCAQTKVVLRQAWLEYIRPVLVLNKIDRLILEMKLSPIAAYYHLTQVLEQVNAYMGELYNMDVLGRVAEEAEEKAKLARERKSSEGGRKLSEGPSASTTYSNWCVTDIDDSDLYFSPERGNVVFASAYDGWGFRLQDFAEKFCKKLELDRKTLNDSFWGDFYISSKGGKKIIMAGAREKCKSPLFVSLILDNLYKLYDTIMDSIETEKMAQTLSIKLPVSISKSLDPRAKLNFIISNWLPLSETILEMVVEHLPSAADITEERARKLMCSATQRFDSLLPQTQDLKEYFIKCCSDDDCPIIVYVSKMFGVDKSSISHKCGGRSSMVKIGELRQHGLVSEMELTNRRQEIINRTKSEIGTQKEESSERHLEAQDDDDDELLIAFARVFSGRLKVGQKVYVLGPKHNPNYILQHCDEKGKLPYDFLKSCEHIVVSEVKEIFLLMGRQFESVNSAPAGAVIGIGGLEGILKSATLSSTPFCPPFTELTLEAAPILRVAVEPSDPKDLPKLRKGLKFLNQADPCVQVFFKDSGEYIILAAGEVHLQRCIEDIKERYAKIDVTVSPPIVPFRETIIPPPMVDRLNEAILRENTYISKQEEKKVGCYEVRNALGFLKVHALPLPPTVTTLLEKNSNLLQSLTNHLASLSSSQQENELGETVHHLPEAELLLSTLNDSKPVIFSDKLSPEALNAIEIFKDELEIAFQDAGSFWIDAVNQIWSFGPNFCGCNLLLNRVKGYSRPSVWDGTTRTNVGHSTLSRFDTNFVTGFQIATAAGPLCEEPMMGVCFIVEDWRIDEQNIDSDSNVTFQVITLAKDALRKAFESAHQRLVCAMYSCVVNVTSEVVGKVFHLIAKRLGRIIDGDITEGSTSWNVTAYLPVIESFNFANELRKSTSGEAMPQLFFSHWETLDIDPFWEPHTLEEVTHWGEKADSDNLARKYITAVRKRKGLATNDKIVEFAEKQRNLSRNK